MMSRIFFIVVFIVISLSAEAQKNIYPKDYFGAPVDIPMLLSGNFGELRTNHFHSGIDIKTNGREGYKIYAVADGYVSRINVSATGFGNAIYVTHPNGFTSVYAHLSDFSDKISKYIEQLQYERESFELTIYPDSNKFPVKKGEVIALSGNSGSSGGPHLHFEIRETASEIPLNPLLFGFDIKDNISPVINKVYIYDTRGYYGNEIISRLDAFKSGNIYTISGRSASVNSPYIGIGISAYDQLNGAPNHNGVYSVILEVDGEEIYHYNFERFAFHESRYINAHIDYAEKQRYRRSIQRLFRLPGNRLSVYRSHQVHNGIIYLSEGEKKEVKITVTDVAGNTSIMQFALTNTTNKYPAKEEYTVLLPPNQQNIFRRENIQLEFPTQALYDTLPLLFSSSEPQENDIFSKIYILNTSYFPLHQHSAISIITESLPSHLKEKALIVHKDQSGRKSSLGGTWKNNKLTATTRELGSFYISVDTVAPEIKPLNIYNGKDMSGERSIRFRINDDFSGIDKYRATVDGNWILMKYDAKNNLLYHEFDGHIKPGAHELVLTVTDERNNKTIYTANFKR